jgi:mono/diheme cytochrome c family protein
MKILNVRGLAIAGLLVGCSVPGLAQQPATQDADVGRSEYNSGCAACHGADGKGTGPVAAVLLTKPADLTIITKNNNGVFPFGRIYDIIDGRQEVKAHGDRAMPVWGYRYSPAPITGTNPAVPYFVDPVYDREPVIRARILAVIDYLYRTQEK